MTTTISLTDLAARGAIISPAEAVAIVQTLIQADSTAVEDRQPLARPSFANIRLSSHGSVVCVGCAARLSTIAEAALLLRELLPEGRHPVPGGLQYAIARALHEVMSRPFESLDEFSHVLSRYQSGPSREVIRGLVARARRPGREVSTDRRRSAPSLAELRRDLREADRDRFELRAALRATESQPRRTVMWSAGQGAIAACLVAGFSLIAAGQLMRPAEQGEAIYAPLRPRSPQHSLPAALDSTPAPHLASSSGPTMKTVSIGSKEAVTANAEEEDLEDLAARRTERAATTERERKRLPEGEDEAQETGSDVTLPAEPASRRESGMRGSKRQNEAQANQKRKKQMFESRELVRIRFEW